MEKEIIKEGVVVKHTGSHYLVSQLPEWKPIICTLRGRLRLKGSEATNPVAVGDKVTYIEQPGGGGVITKIHPRKNYIIRRSVNLSRQAHIIASNLDQALLIVTLRQPAVKLEFIDRFLVTAEAYRVPATIILNKSDLHQEGDEELQWEVERFYQIYRESAGYQILETSTLNNQNIDQLERLCKNRLSLFTGASGVGKSSLINALDPTLDVTVGEISQYHQQGRHTTTFYEIHPIESGGFIIDSPGIRGFGLVDMEQEELSHYFPEMLKLVDQCRFSPCTHTHEPQCAIKEAVENEEITEERYISYLNMLEEEGKYR